MTTSPKFKTASGLILWYMRKCGFRGWTSFWNTIYLAPGSEFDPKLRQHELAHIDQINRDGKLLFAIKYTYWTLKHGYWNNPYEVEARAAAERKQN